MAKIPPRSAARITSLVRAFVCKGFMEFPHPEAEAGKTDASYNKRQMMSLFRQKRKPRVFGGYEDPGWGYNRGGGRRKLEAAQCTWCMQSRQIFLSASYVKKISS